MSGEYDPFVRGRFPVGVRTIQALDRVRGRLFPSEDQIGSCFFRLHAELGRLHERAQQRYVSPVDFAVLLTALGEKDAAFARLEEAYRTKATRLNVLKTSWEFISLRSDPRWSDLVHRLKLD
jgi:hypothetical protein